MLTTKEQFGLKIKSIREEKHFTVRQAALQGGFSSAYLSQIENGKKNIPKVETLYKIAQGLRISNDEILELAGIGTKKDNINKIDEQFEEELVLAFDGKPIPDSDKQKILEYVELLKLKRERENE
ncbi:hypothetical protein LABALGNA3A7_05590 [Dellaglioa algida]|nr:hypothetical protein LABALGNA3A7_05590 [Dellaglioa algida]